MMEEEDGTNKQVDLVDTQMVKWRAGPITVVIFRPDHWGLVPSVSTLTSISKSPKKVKKFHRKQIKSCYRETRLRNATLIDLSNRYPFICTIVGLTISLLTMVLLGRMYGFRERNSRQLQHMTWNVTGGAPIKEPTAVVSALFFHFHVSTSDIGRNRLVIKGGRHPFRVRRRNKNWQNRHSI